MKVRTKIILRLPQILWWNRRSRKLAKKAMRDEENERYPIQWKNDWVIKKAKKILKVLKVELTVKGFENIPKQPALLVANHASSLDSVLVLAALNNPGKTPEDINQKAIFIAKEELSKNRRFKGYANLLNTFYINRNNPRQALQTFNDALEEIKSSKRHLIIFPEGTRSDDGHLQDFKGGAFRIAKRGYLPIVPITINNSLAITNFNRRKVIKVEVIFHVGIRPLSFVSSDTKGIAGRVQKVVKSQWRKPEGKKSKADKKLA